VRYSHVMSHKDSSGRSDPAYLSVGEAIAASIRNGQVTGRLPSERDFAVSYKTFRRAMHILRQRGVIISRQDRGTFPDPNGPPAPST
jgi:DNA-binding GntR family transcriptional regulator